MDTSKPARSYTFFDFPAELRNMMYFYLLKASYGDAYQPSLPTSHVLSNDASRFTNTPPFSCLNILRVSRQVKQEATVVLYREGIFNITAGWIRTERTFSLLNQDFMDLVQKVNFYTAWEAPLSEEEVALLGALLRQLGNTPITRETFKISMATALVRTSEWQIIVRGLEGLKRFKTVIIDVINNWVIAFEKKYPNMGPILMPSSIRDTLEMELGASTLESRSGRPCIVFYLLGK